MPTAFPSRWEATIVPGGITEEWNEAELLQALECFRLKLEKSVKICIFIDGLDEYEGQPASLIALVKMLAAIPNVKLCISSRPWNEFENEYGCHKDHKLYMERLNMPDILRYVEDIIGQHPHYNYLQKNGCDDLVTEIVDKSRGVFLWVYLVVRDLLQGLDNSDRAIDIERRLRRMPADLKGFFRHMVLSLDPIYRIPTAKVFQVAIHAGRPMYMLNYWHLDMEEEDPEFAMKHKLAPYGRARVAEQAELMAKRINARCRGLLEPVKNVNVDFWFGPKVHFLHPTAKDYMESEEMQKLLEEWHPIDNINEILCKLLLAQVKSAMIDEWHLTREGRLSDIVEHFVRCVGQIEIDTRSCLFELVNEFSSVIERLAWQFCGSSLGAPWRYWPDASECHSFFDYAARNGLKFYRERAIALHNTVESENNISPTPSSKRSGLRRFRKTLRPWRKVRKTRE